MTKTIFILAIAASSFVACNSSNTTKEYKPNPNQNFGFDTTKLKTGEAYYQCEMHPEIISNENGECPKCEGMELEQIKKR